MDTSKKGSSKETETEEADTHKEEKRADDRDLDRELRDYWLTQKGGNKGEEGKL